MESESLSPEIQETLEHLAHAAEWINRFTTPFFDQKEISDEKNGTGFLQNVTLLKEHLDLKDALYPDGHSVQAEVRVYHRMLEQAFMMALGEGQTSD